MIGPDELAGITRRLLVAAEAAKRLARATGDVFFDAPEYEVVMESLDAMNTDVRRLLAEHEILRGMFADRLSSFLKEEVEHGNGRGDVVPVPIATDGGSGEGERKDEPIAEIGVQPRRTVRRRAKRSKPRRDTAGVRGDSGEVGSGD